VPRLAPPCPAWRWGILCAGSLAVASAGCSSSDATSLPELGSGGTPASALVYEQDLGGNKDLYLVPTGGGQPVRLTHHPASDGMPRFTADGRGVIYTTDRSGNWQLWQISVDGGEPERVRTNAHTEWQADESPDGHWLAFLSNQEGPEYLWIMNRQSGEQRALIQHGNRTIMGNPDWGPTGARIVFSSNWRRGHQIYVVDVASDEVDRVSPITSGGCEPRLSPDGKKVVYVSRRHLKATSHLVEHDLETGEQKVLVDWPALNYDPVYSPDGTELAFASNIAGEYAIYRQRFSDGKAFRVTFEKEQARYPDYRPLPRQY